MIHECVVSISLGGWISMFGYSHLVYSTGTLLILILLCPCESQTSD